MANIGFFNWKYFIDVDGLFLIHKMVEIHHTKKFNYIINIFLYIIYNIFQDCLVFSISFMLKLFTGFKVWVIEIIFNFLSIKKTFFSLKFFISKFWSFYFCSCLFLKFHYFSKIFPQKITKLQKIINIKIKN